ncbi:MAG TPA: YfbU family protein [Hyphomicrobiales bacterium]|nr:YfbU family protein [Hyphomicrobiales bacterium]
MTYLSNVERRILINQLQILAVLDRKQGKGYESSMRLLAGAMNDADSLEPVRQIAMAEVDEPMTFTFRVLSLYSFLQNAFYALDLKEKLQIDHTALVFPGFDAHSERIYSDHVSFIRNGLGQFTLLEIWNNETPQAPMAPFYRKLLALKVGETDAVLDLAGITDMIETISELLAQTNPNGGQLETASAA